MAKATTNITGMQLADFCRELFAEALDGDREAAEILVRDFAEQVTAIRVRRDRLTRRAKTRKPAGAAAEPATLPAPEPVIPAPPPVAPEPVAPPVRVVAELGERPFDPYAFSVIALMSKKGRDALSHRLGEIRNAADLRQLAEAQGLSIDGATLTATGEALDDLRLAIMTAAEQRIADRRAAAS